MPNLDRFMPVIAPLLRGVIAGSQSARRSQFSALPPCPDRVLFLGDSITEQGVWDEWFPELPTLNRGIGGETVGQVTARLDSAIMAPRAISLLIGTNDLGGLGASRKVEDIAGHMRKLAQSIRERAGAAPLFINSVLPRSAYFRDRIRALNQHYQHIAAECGATYINVWPALADGSGALRADCTADGLHLTGAGYRVWTDLLRPHLGAFG